MGVKGPDQSTLIARVGDLTCAIPIELVIETMRPLPVEPLGHGPAYVRGVAIVRGEPTVVIDVGALLAITTEHTTTRFVLVRAGARKAALMVDAVIDIRKLGALGDLPPLAASANRGVIEAIGAVDAGLVVVLEATKLIEAAG